MQELRGMPVVKSLLADFEEKVTLLNEKNIVPRLVVVRVGARDEDLAYERGIRKRFADAKAIADTLELPPNVTQEELNTAVEQLNKDESVHGIMLFRPLPKHLSEKAVKDRISEWKDVDCMGTINNAHIFAGDKDGYPPCTPQAVMEMLDFYQIPLQGKKVTIVGRSMVVGRPLAMLMLAKNATVTICHTKTENLADECQKADIILACAGVAKMISENYVNQNQTVIDVGINMDGDKLCGDVDYEAVSEKVAAITPVPGGVGTVTTSVLLKHTIMSAMRTANIEM